MTKTRKKPNTNQRAVIQRRNLDPKNYVVLKDTPSTLYLIDVRYNKIKLIHKYN